MVRDWTLSPQDWEEGKNVLSHHSQSTLYWKSYLVNKTRKGNKSSVDWKRRNKMLLFTESMIFYL